MNFFSSQIFFNVNNCCIAAPAPYIIGIGNVSVNQNVKLLPPTITVSPTNTSCNPSNPSPGGPSNDLQTV